PADGGAAGAREVALGLAGADRRRRRDAVLRRGERLPVERARDPVELAIAARPLRVVRERGPALVIEEREVVVACGGRESTDGDRGGGHAHIIAPARSLRTPALVGRASARRGATIPLWVGLQPDAAPRSRCGSGFRLCGSGVSPTGCSDARWVGLQPLWVGLQPDGVRADATEMRRPEGRPTDAQTVGLKPDPQMAARYR